MGSIKQSGVSDPLDLEIIEQAYEAAWTAIALREPFRDTGQDNERKVFLRKRTLAVMRSGVTDPAALADKVLASMPGLWISPVSFR
jgi:hypothetical protein